MELYRAKQKVRLRGPDGTVREFMPGDTFGLKEASRLIESGKVERVDGNVVHIYSNPFKQDTPDARQESLIQVMEATWKTECLPLYRTGFQMTEAIMKAEKDVEAAQWQALTGKGSLDTFRTACLLLKNEIQKGEKND